jgi:hypothetical protein
MRYLLRHVPVPVVPLFVVAVVVGPAAIDLPNVVVKLEVVGPHHVHLALLVDMVENFQGTRAQQFVVSIDQQHNVLFIAMLRDCGVDIGHSSQSLLVSYQSYVVRDLIFLNPLLDELVGVVGRCVIDDHYFEVLVVEVDHRLQVILVPEIASVIDRRHHDAERQLREAKVILLRQSIAFPGNQLVPLPLHVNVEVR